MCVKALFGTLLLFIELFVIVSQYGWYKDKDFDHRITNIVDGFLVAKTTAKRLLVDIILSIILGIIFFTFYLKLVSISTGHEISDYRSLRRASTWNEASNEDDSLFIKDKGNDSLIDSPESDASKSVLIERSNSMRDFYDNGLGDNILAIMTNTS